MKTLSSFPIDDWSGTVAANDRGAAIAALESGQVVFFPKLAFCLLPSERPLLSPALSNGRSKNISLDPNGRLEHAMLSEEHALLPRMMERFAECTHTLLCELFPNYAPKLERARTSYRPVEIAGRRSSRLGDDTLLHIDAFPAHPLQGRRILRVFSNIHPGDVPRVWSTGDPFAEMAAKLLPRVKAPGTFKPRLLAALGATRGLRSPYDSFMLALHDRAKLDADYQRDTAKNELRFPPGSTWLCFTDQVMHAVLSGQFALEQTFHLDVDAMAEPARAPISVLEAMLGRRLT